MTTVRRRQIASMTVLTLLGWCFAGASPRGPQEVYGPAVRAIAVNSTFPRWHARRHSASAADGLRYWNQLAVDASGVDHTPVAPGENRIFGEQLGPGRSSRAMAIVHIAIFDAIDSIVGGYRSYAGVPRSTANASLDAAIAAAAHDTLIALYPSQKNGFDAAYDEDLHNRLAAQEPQRMQAGIAAGHRAAHAILTLRAQDGAAQVDPRLGTEWPTSDAPGHWRQDPVSHSPIALGAHWADVRPFVLHSAAQFRAPPPPALTSDAYAAAFNEVKALGGDGVHTPTTRTAEQTETGIFWAYDGTPSLCAPPRLYNQIVAEISKHMTNVLELARLFALVNVAMADAGIAIWDSKYYYDYWRPVTGIREADSGTGPTGAGDDNAQTSGDSGFWPLGAPASNLTGPNFTPPFPAYPSGHAGFGGALFQILRRFYGTDRVSFSFVSDEFNGETLGSDGVVRPFAPRSFATLSQAEEENGQSRIYLGIHWAFDKTEGIRLGRRVADHVFRNAFRPQR
jgi:PAP2 superfamily